MPVAVKSGRRRAGHSFPHPEQDALPRLAHRPCRGAASLAQRFCGRALFDGSAAAELAAGGPCRVHAPRSSRRAHPPHAPRLSPAARGAGGRAERRLGPHLTIDTPDQGLHLVAYLRGKLSDIEIEKAARDSGVVVRAMSRLYRRAPPWSALMLGFSGYPPQRLAHAAARLGMVIHCQSKQPGKRRQGA